MKFLILSLVIISLIESTQASGFEDCDHTKAMCKRAPCVAAVVQSLDSNVASSTCVNVYSRPYKDEAKWDYLYTELEVLNTAPDARITATKIRVKEME